MTEVEYFSQIAAFPPVMRRNEYVDLFEIVPKIRLSQQFCPAWFFQIAGKDDAQAVITNKRNEAQIVGVLKGRIRIVERDKLDSREI